MPLDYRPATADDVPRCIQLRALTRHNAVSAERLASYGITADSWGDALRRGEQAGFVATQQGDIVGYCFGDTRSGEVLVLALLPAHEDQGVGRRLLDQVVERLRAAGHRRLFLGCSTDAATRSHGFYRHLGWVPTGRIDAHGDEILEYAALAPQPLNSPMSTAARVHLFPAMAGTGQSCQVAPEKRIAGNPTQTVWLHYASEDQRFCAGLWHSGVGKWSIRYTEDEYCHILEGCSIVTADGGATVTLRPGDQFVIPRGFVGTWEVVEPTLKRFVIHEVEPAEPS